MSRAFVNEDTAAAQVSQPVERQVSAQPNYVTPAGLLQLQARVAALQTEYAQQQALGDNADKQRQADIERDLRYFNQRVQSAQVVVTPSNDKVSIGSWVIFADIDDVDTENAEQRVQLVGEDQADAARGLINWGSPLGKVLLGAAVDDEVLWRRPAGDRTIAILAIEAE